jgi:hypothetical protein
MYVVSVLLLLGVLPAGSIFMDQHYNGHGVPLMLLVDTWYPFWAVGVRLVLAGARQALQPRFTAREIFNIQSDDALPIVRELGLANLAMGAIGLLSLRFFDFLLPAAILGGLYYGLAFVLHLLRRGKTFNERFAMMTDLLAFATLAAVAFDRYSAAITAAL